MRRRSALRRRLRELDDLEFKIRQLVEPSDVLLEHVRREREWLHAELESLSLQSRWKK